MAKNNMDPIRKSSQPARKNTRKETEEQIMIEKAAEWLEKNKLGPDDTFRFHCTQCGKCCINREDILLNARDVFGMAKGLGITPVELIEKYGEIYIGSESHIPVARLKPVGQDKRCPLLDKAGQKCLVHKVKPTVCAMYPIGRAAVRDIDGSGNGAKIEYFFTNPNCGDGKETHTLRDWLENFAIPLEDEVFQAWQQIIVDLSLACIKFEKVFDENEMKQLWNKVLFLMYLNYNTEGDFLTQFHSNMGSLQKLAGKASELPEEPEAKAAVKIKAKPVQWNERVSFECQKCGACCRHIKRSVPIDCSDMFRLAQFFQKSETESVNMKELLNKYAEPVLLHDCGYVMFTLKTTEPEDACIFLKNNMCMIQEAKPLACRTYPLFADPNVRGSFDYYLSTEQPHHFNGRQIKVRDWMKHNFNREDQAFVKKDFADAMEIIQLLLNVPEPRKDEAIHYFIKFRYTEYDLEQPFFEQYKRNNEFLMDYLRRLT